MLFGILREEGNDMPLPDFIKEQSVNEQGESAATRRAAPEISNLPENIKAQAVEAAHPAAKLIEQATQQRTEFASGQPEHRDGKEALIRNQGDQGKEQSAMSPTDHG